MGQLAGVKDRALYLNGEEISEKYEKEKWIFRRTLNKGSNQAIISLKTIRNIGFWLDFFNEDRVEISIQVVDTKMKTYSICRIWYERHRLFSNWWLD